MTGPRKVRTKSSGVTATIPRPANSELSGWRLYPASVKRLQPGESIPVILVIVRQFGNTENFFSAWVTRRKWAGAGLNQIQLLWNQ